MNSSWFWFYALFYGALLLGWSLRTWKGHAGSLMRFNILFLDAPLFLFSFWTLALSRVATFAWIPLISLILILLALWLTPLWTRQHLASREAQGSFILSAAFSNIGTTGGAFICYLLFGLPGLSLGYLFLLPYPFLIFTLGFGTAGAYAGNKPLAAKDHLQHLFTNPLSFVPLAAMAVGLGLNLGGIKPWEGLNLGADVFIKVGLGLQCFAIGMTLKPSQFFSPWQPVLALSLIKFILLPLLAVVLIWVAYGSLMPLPAKIILIQAAMPPAIYSVITANLFKLDSELSNSLWISATLLLIPVAGLLFLLLG